MLFAKIKVNINANIKSFFLIKRGATQVLIAVKGISQVQALCC